MSAGHLRYSPRVLELFRKLPGAGTLPAGAGTVVAGEAVALDRGAWVRFEARLEAGRVAECRFRAFGCPHTLAAAALAASKLANAAAADAPAVDARLLARELDVPAEKLGRLLVVEDAIHALLAALPRVQ
jgi:NifU-like protein involved in Fe-S cluster formation